MSGRSFTEIDLQFATENCQKSVVFREYSSDKKGNEKHEEEVNIILDKGYSIQGQNAEGSHVHADRLILTGGLSIFAGRRGIRSKSKTTVAYVKT